MLCHISAYSGTPGSLSVNTKLRFMYLMLSKKKNLLFLWGWDRQVRPSRSLNKSPDTKLWFSGQFFLLYSHTHDIFLYVNNLGTVHHTLVNLCHRLRVRIYLVIVPTKTNGQTDWHRIGQTDKQKNRILQSFLNINKPYSWTSLESDFSPT